MAKVRKRSVMDKKVKKKRWLPILAPELFNKTQVGEIPLVSADVAVGRMLTANLMNITHDIKQQNINVSLRIDQVTENQAHTKIHSFKIMPSAVKRMTHRRVDIIEDSSIFLTSDKVRVRIKPMLFTRGNTSSPVRKALRKGMRNIILKTVKNTKADDLFRDALSNKIQHNVIKELNALYPLKRCVIRELSIEKERTRKKAKAVETEVEVPKTRRGKKVKEEDNLQGKKKPEEPEIIAGVVLEPEEPETAPEPEPESAKPAAEPEFKKVPAEEPKKEEAAPEFEEVPEEK